MDEDNISVEAAKFHASVPFGVRVNRAKVPLCTTSPCPLFSGSPSHGNPLSPWNTIGTDPIAWISGALAVFDVHCLSSSPVVAQPEHPADRSKPSLYLSQKQ